MSTRDTVTRSPGGIWFFAVSSMAAISQPRTDVEASDAAVDALLRDSTLGGWAVQVLRMLDQAWAGSRTRAVTRGTVIELRGLNHRDAIRMASWLGIVAALVVLLLLAIKPTPSGPFGWIVPGVLAAASLAAWIGAKPLALALEHRRL
jgi:hypothetical protein